MKLEKNKKWTWPAEKMREWTDVEIKTCERDFSQQLVRLRFQLLGGQSDVLPVIREIRKAMARVKTVERERELKLSTQAKA